MPIVSRGPDPDVTEREILLFMVTSPDPAFTANEIAEEFDKTRQWADNRMRQMGSDSLLRSKNPGGRAKFHWVTESGKAYLQEGRD